MSEIKMTADELEEFEAELKSWINRFERGEVSVFEYWPLPWKRLMLAVVNRDIECHAARELVEHCAGLCGQSYLSSWDPTVPAWAAAWAKVYEAERPDPESTSLLIRLGRAADAAIKAGGAAFEADAAVPR
jgi:hypothetical protein